MKNFILIISFLMAAAAGFAQNIDGSWSGRISANLEIVFNIHSRGDGILTATMDSPSQGARGISMDDVSFNDGTLTIKCKALDMSYSGMYLLGVFNGTFTQRGISIPLALGKTRPAIPRRPQTPVAPFPYSEEEVRFTNTRDGILLGGTLTLPKEGRNLHGVVLVSGSGAQDRNEEIYEHKPFAVIADYLTRAGMAVLRFDDRGVGDSEAGKADATTQDLSYDAEAAIDYMLSRPEIADISIIGHSEGGIIAYMIAARREDIHKVISLAGTAVSGHDILIEQTKALMTLQGLPEASIEQSMQINTTLYDMAVEHAHATAEEFKATADSTLKRLMGVAVTDEQIAQYSSQICNQWTRYFICHDPSEDILKVKCPLLYMNGTKDCQVVSRQNIPAMRKLAENNKNIIVEEFEGLNHLFQEAKTGATTEYYEIEQTISPTALEMMTSFLLE